MFRILISKLCFLGILIFFLPGLISAQDFFKKQSAFCLSGSAQPFSAQQKHYHIKQSIGQFGISGTIHAENKTLIQGFILPEIPKGKASGEKIPEILIHPIPHTDSYRVLLDNGAENNYVVSIYNIHGQIIYSRRTHYLNEFEISLNSHPVGYYFISIEGKQERYISKLPKLK